MAEQRTRFVGTYPHGLDDKGRMVLPAKIRVQLGETGMVGMADQCLGLWTLEGFDAIADRLSAAVTAGEAEREVLRKFMAFAAEVTPDQQGRVIIPQVLRTYASLGSEVVVNGALERAEIWAKDLTLFCCTTMAAAIPTII
jgi:MraZ protein